MKEYNRVCAKIDLDAIEANIEQMRANIPEQTRIMAVIKTDGYGHGAIPIARLLEPKDYIWGFAVATLDEAVVLRNAGITKDLLVLGCIFPDQFADMLDYDIQMTAYSLELVRPAAALAAGSGRTIKVHLKIDTGMGRLGFRPDAAAVQEICELAALPGLTLEGLYTHFAKADETDKTYTGEQLRKYEWLSAQLTAAGLAVRYRHTANSAGIIDVPASSYDLVRAGISTYGLYPSAEVARDRVRLTPALTLESHIVYLKEVPAGTRISYGGTYVTTRESTRVATIPVGYGDGYPRSLSNRGCVLIHGQKAPILGRVCMDQFMVDVSDIAGVNVYDKVTLVGYNGNEHLPVEVLSELSGRFNYEFVCDLGKRIPREYYRHGRLIQQKDYFNP